MQQIFLSHDSRDAELAKVISDAIIRASLQQINVWYSSDSSSEGGLRPGHVWVDEVRSQLRSSCVLLVLITKNSVDRPWINFEGGFGFSNDACHIVPIFVGVSIRDVESPFKIFQCYELNSLESLKKFLAKFFKDLSVNFDEEMVSPFLSSTATILEYVVSHSVNEKESNFNSSKQLEICLDIFETIYDSLPIMIHSIDETGVIRRVNQKWIETLGYQSEEVIGKSADFLMTPSSAKLAMLMVIPEFWRTGFCENAPYQYRKKDGTIVNVVLNCVATQDKNGDRISLTFIQDVRDYPELAGIRKESKLRYDRKLAEQSAGFYETDLGGNFTDIDDSFATLVGISKEEVLGKDYRTILAPSVSKIIFNIHADVYRNRRTRSGIALKVPQNDKMISILMTFSLLTTEDGKAAGFRGVYRVV